MYKVGITIAIRQICPASSSDTGTPAFSRIICSYLAKNSARSASERKDRERLAFS